MAAPNHPQVSVFHFTSRISSAKIKKYKLATERGMTGGTTKDRATATKVSSEVKATTPHSTTFSVQTALSSVEPPSKKPKLRLNMERPCEGVNSNAVPRPQRDSALRIRYSENMNVPNEYEDDFPLPSHRLPKPSLAALPALSSVPTIPRQVKKEPVAPVKDATPNSTKQDYGGDFMSYYITGDDDNELSPAAKPTPKPDHVSVPVPTPAGHSHQLANSPGAKVKQIDVTTSIPATTRVQPPVPLPPLPTVELIDDILKNAKPGEPDTVDVMIKKLEALSAALTDFGRVPEVPKAPRQGQRNEPEEQLDSRSESKSIPNGPKKQVDDFLAMFDDDDSDEENQSKENGENDKDTSCKDLNYRLEFPGTPDAPLTYGIQFIQHALKSWAQQRLNIQYAQHIQQVQQQTHVQAQQQKRGPGRPRKFHASSEERPQPPQSPATIRMALSNTPEGMAIAAFQQVLESSCLRVNSRLPIELASALRHLYMQIDHLINQGSKNEGDWQCMSYGAQIKAQKVRVEKWKEDQVKAQEEMTRQQQLARQQMMQQMGVPPQHQRVSMTAEQAQHAHAMELERRRGLQHAAQQPHLSQYLTNPLRLNSPPSGNLSPFAQLAPPSTVNSVPTGSPGSAQQEFGKPNESPNPSHGLSSRKSSMNTNFVNSGTTLDKMKMYVPGFLPRSGQSMKFSFAPHSEMAIKAFGAQAFPLTPSTSNIPNRGPMRHPAGHISSPSVVSNGVTPLEMSTPDSNFSLLRSTGRKENTTLSPDVTMENSESTASQGPAPPKNKDNVVDENSIGALNGAPSRMGGFTAINNPGATQKLNAVPASDPLPRQSIVKGSGTQKPLPFFNSNGSSARNFHGIDQTQDLTSRFTRPGAIVVDR